MNNSFIAHYFDWADGSALAVRVANRLLKLAGSGVRFRAPGSTGAVTSIEQRINLYHLVSQVLAYRVPGDLLEVGTFTGETAALIGKIVAGEGPGRRLHVYDSFRPTLGCDDPRTELEANFHAYALPLPQVHAGDFADTMPHGLPSEIAFVHVDCGHGGDPRVQEEILVEVMEHIYPRLSPGAVCSIVDYWDPDEHRSLPNLNPGVKPALDRLLADKAERVSVLYAAEYCHAYFRKHDPEPALANEALATSVIRQVSVGAS